MKLFRVFALIVAALAGSAFFSPSEEWELVFQQDGIEFYVTHRTSRVSEQVNTVIKVRNTASFSTLVSFTPVITCGGSAGASLEPEKANLNPSGDTALFNYKSCTSPQGIKVSIRNFSFQKTGK